MSLGDTYSLLQVRPVVTKLNGRVDFLPYTKENFLLHITYFWKSNVDRILIINPIIVSLLTDLETFVFPSFMDGSLWFRSQLRFGRRDKDVFIVLLKWIVEVLFTSLSNTVFLLDWGNLGNLYNNSSL